MLTMTVLAVEVIVWQSNDISVSIDSVRTDGTEIVSISVLNTAGMTLLFYENSYMMGKIEYFNEGVWEEFCEVSYTGGNASAISQQYAGMFAELNPGETWDIQVPEDMADKMTDGMYRVKMTYITSDKYEEWLDELYLLQNDAEAESLPAESVDAVPLLHEVSGKDDTASTVSEEYGALSLSEEFIKSFDYTKYQSDSDQFSIDESDISGDSYHANAVYSQKYDFLTVTDEEF